MRFKSLVFIVFLILSSLNAEEWNSFSYTPSMDAVYHPVSTKNPEVQRAFNRGLLAMYAFNHDEAFASFRRASEMEPSLAMAYWGMALALGENINLPISLEREKKAFELIQKAMSLSKNASENEQAYINALSTRYSDHPQPDLQRLREDYAKAMKKVVEMFPDDLDAATLYTESMLDLKPWKLWSIDGKPAEGTLEVVELLESILKRDPHHLGANHFYIHAIEASKNPERALLSAYRLNNLLPDWGHILHMPSHIFILVGDYEMAAKANIKAIQADQNYISEHGLSGFYPLHYMSHNIYFLCRAYLWEDNYEHALEAANYLNQFLSPHIQRMPDLEYYLLAPLQVYLYFHQWNAILNVPKPSLQLTGLTCFWHFARSMAYASLNSVEKAEKEKAAFLKKKMRIPVNQHLGYNSAKQVLDIAEDVLEASLAKAKGDLKLSVDNLRKAVQKQDLLNYNEPPDWFYPIRQTLGAHIMTLGDFEEAEIIFRQALERLPRNGRSLFGLLQALKAQNKFDYWIARETNEALKHASHPLNLNDL